MDKNQNNLCQQENWLLSFNRILGLNPYDNDNEKKVKWKVNVNVSNTDKHFVISDHDEIKKESWFQE